MKKIILVGIFFLALFIISLVVSAEEKQMNIAIVLDGPHYVFDELCAKLKDEVNLLLGDDFNVAFPVVIDAGWDTGRINEQIQSVLENDEIDIVVSLGEVASIAFLQVENLQKPVITPSIIQPYIFDLVSEEGYSTKKNFLFIAGSDRALKDLSMFAKLVSFTELHVLIDKSIFPLVKMYNEKINAKHNLSIRWIPVTDDLKDAIMQLQQPIQALYITPLRFNREDFITLVDEINKRKIPSFSYEGGPDVEIGVFAGLSPDLTDRIVRRLALNIQRILLGEDINKISVKFDTEERLKINMKTARMIGVSPDFEILLQARLMNADDSDFEGKRLSIFQAIDEAVANNFLFDIKEQEIVKAKQTANSSWSSYFPQANYSQEYQVIDSETAKLSFGQSPKRNHTYNLSVSQMIFSDPLITNIRSSLKRIKVRKLEYESQKLEVIESVAKQYLGYLQAKALHRIELNNLKRVIHHLELAKRRMKIGTAGPEEVYRWQAEEATSRSDVIKAESTVFKQKVIMNQLMNRPQETPFIEEDVFLETLDLFSREADVWEGVRNIKTLRDALDFLVHKGIERSPDIQAIIVAAKVQNIEKAEKLRKFFLPELSASGSFTHKIHDKFYGSIPENEHDDWVASFKATYPIFEGGKRFYDYNYDRAEWKRLEYKAKLAKEETERSIRESFYNMFYSFPNIQLSYIAADNAHKNLEVIADKYAQGKVSITDLLDAQNDAFVKESKAAISVYSYLADLIAFEKAISFFEFYIKDDSKKLVLDELREYLKEKRLKS